MRCKKAKNKFLPLFYQLISMLFYYIMLSLSAVNSETVLKVIDL
jgi:hypothetical protein